jgi:MFS family permease
MPILILGRVISGLGAGGMVPISMAIAADLISPRERGKWTGLQQVLFGGIGISAPALGGWITDHTGWRWNFFLVVGLGLISLTVAWLGVRIPRTSRAHQIDFVGAALIMLGAGTLLLAVTLGGEQYAWTSPLIIAMMVAAAASLAAFPVWELRVKEPIFPLALFKNRTFALAQIGIVGTHSVLLTTLTLAPLVIQGVLGLSATATGSLMIAYSLTSMAVGFAVGQLVSRTGRYREVLVLSPVVLAVSCYRLGTLDGFSTPADAGIDMVLFGAGVGLVNGTLIVVVQNAVGSAEQGIASAGMAFTRILAGAVSVAVVGAVMTARVGAEVAHRVPGAEVTKLSVGRLIDLGGTAGAGGKVLREAFIAGAPGAFLILLPLLAVTFVAMWMVERRDLRRTLVEADPAA